jgi:hypothetical protein
VPPDAVPVGRRIAELRDNIAAMRALAIALVLVAAGCGGKRQVAAGPPAAAAAFPAARFVPGTPTYVFASRTVRDAQRAFGNSIDTLGMFAGVDRAEVSAALTHVLQVDPLSADAMSAIGVDLDGGMALFSAEIDPTLVVQLSQPQLLQDFIARQRERGMNSQSVMIEGTEVFTAKASDDISVSWAVDANWLWVHVAFAPHGDQSNWFAASKRAGAARWGAQWESAQALAQKQAGLLGIIDLRAFAAKIAARMPSVAPCAQQLEAVNGIGVAFEAEGGWVSGKVAIDAGAPAQAIASSMLAPPPGWAAASANAPLSVQWNLDLRTVAQWAQPCSAEAARNMLAIADDFGVRTGRAFAHTLDPDDKEGTGVLALDLAHARYIEAQLGQIPMRSKLERARQFGAYKGKHLSIPFVATVDYVLDDRVFMLAMGDGQLARATAGTPAPPPVFAIDLLPPGFSVGVWAWLLEEAEVPQPKRVAQQLQGWADLHVAGTLSGQRLIVHAQGNRR